MYIEAEDMKKSIEKIGIWYETKRLIRELYKYLTEQEKERLKDKKGEEYYKEIKGIIERKNIRIKGYERLEKYIKYLEKEQRIEKEKVIEEEGKLEYEIKKKIVEENKRLQEIINKERYMKLGKKLVENKISYGEYEEYKELVIPVQTGIQTYRRATGFPVKLGMTVV